MLGIATELREVIKWIPKEELNCKYYKSYFDRVTNDLKTKVNE